jgi:hypothetical protein
MKYFKHKLSLTPGFEIKITDNYELYRKWAANEHSVIEPDDNSNWRGRCIGTLIWVHEYGYLPAVVHELVHATSNWMATVGLSNDPELRAYAMGNAFAAYLEFMEDK